MKNIKMRTGFFLCRQQNGTLWLCTERPYRNERSGNWTVGAEGSMIRIPQSLFPEVTVGDEYPATAVISVTTVMRGSSCKERRDEAPAEGGCSSKSINKCIFDEKTGMYHPTLKMALQNKVPGSYIVRVWRDAVTGKWLGSIPLFGYGSHINSIKIADSSIMGNLVSKGIIHN